MAVNLMEVTAEDGMRDGAVTGFFKGLGDAFQGGSKVISVAVSAAQQVRSSTAGQLQPAILHLSVFLAPSSTVNTNFDKAIAIKESYAINETLASAEWRKFKKNNGCTTCGVSYNEYKRTCHNEVAYNEPPRGHNFDNRNSWNENAPLVGWRLYPA